MGQKINPVSFRIGINKTWDSRWLAKKDYPIILHEDFAIRTCVNKLLSKAAVSRVVIERVVKKVIVYVFFGTHKTYTYPALCIFY